MDPNRFALGAGRKRPAYKPKDIHCPNCGAGFTVKQEQTELVVCDYCGSHLDVSKEEKKVISGGDSQKWEFPLEIGDSFRHKGERYEIIGRMVFIEDGDYSERTRQYLLFHPFHGTLWLDEYQGRYSLSEDTHVMPESDAFSKSRGSTLKTHDNRTWVCEGTGEYELVYVDGALPWIARIGDRIDYAEFSGKSGSGLQYEVQRIENEQEYGMGEALTIQEVREATGKPDIPGLEPGSLPLDAGSTRKWYGISALTALGFLVINFVIFIFAVTSGHVVLRQTFDKSEMNGETLSQPFRLKSGGQVIKVTATPVPGLDNSWMSMNVAVVKGDDMVIDVFDEEIAYYHGYSGGESWSEGSRSESVYIKIPESGTYRLLLHAVSNYGNSSTANSSRHGARVFVKAGAHMARYSVIAMVICIISLVILGFSYAGWKSMGEEDDDDDW